jgi:hypothetical protein
MAGLITKLRGKGKLVAATMSAITATTVAVVTFTSGAGGVDQLAAAEDIRWNGPVGLLDADYQHLVIVGKIGTVSRADEYVVGDVRDPMVAPTGALKVRTSPKPEGPAKPARVTLPNMWLSGIIWDEQSPIAMIDGLDYRVGDRVKGARIVKIRMDSVVLSFASKEYVLTVD